MNEWKAASVFLGYRIQDTGVGVTGGMEVLSKFSRPLQPKHDRFQEYNCFK